MQSLSRKLADYNSGQMHSFHTPGHKTRKDLLSSIVFPDYDLTELPGLDMLHNPQGIIADAQKQAALAYGAEETFFLVNGATSGNQAMFLTLMSRIKDKKVRIDRRAHRSVMSALIISGICPEYIPPVIHPEFNLPLGLDEKKFMPREDSIGAVHITSPSYYGTVADLQSVILFRDKERPDLPVLIDQAHGAHYRGNRFPLSAVQQGADLVIHSTHKTLSALTQSAMLHVQGDRIERTSLKKSLEVLLTSSPNYLLMASLENAVNDLANTGIWDELYAEVIQLQEGLNGALRVLTGRDKGQYGIFDVDWSKILVNVSSLQLRAPEAVDILRNSYRIEPELWDENNILFLLGIGNTPQEVRILRQALESLVTGYKTKTKTGQKGKNKICRELFDFVLPPLHLTPREAWLAPKRVLRVKDSLGKICGETISVYPPGIPLITAGEEITSYVLSYLLQAPMFNWQGWSGYNRGEIQVINI